MNTWRVPMPDGVDYVGEGMQRDLVIRATKEDLLKLAENILNAAENQS